MLQLQAESLKCRASELPVFSLVRLSGMDEKYTKGLIGAYLLIVA